MKRIFLSPPHLSGQEEEYIGQALASNYIAPVGPDLDAFEEEMRLRLGGRVYCVAVASGTAALHLAARICGMNASDAVLCSDLTFIASISPVVWQGARPIFVDADHHTWNINLDLLEEYLKREAPGLRPRFLLATHLYGQPLDLERTLAICDRYGLELIEDAAEALGSTFNGCPCGVSGRFGALSFNGNKIITSSGGGMLLCRDRADADKARYLATQARDPVPYYRHSQIGFNYRLSNICAAIGRAQLKVLDERVDRRRAIFAAYEKRLGDIPAIEFMPEVHGGFANRWLSCILFRSGGDLEKSMPELVRAALEKENIEARPIWNPMHRQPVFKGHPVIGGAAGEDIFARGLCLPSGTAMTEADLDRICNVVRATVQAHMP